MNEKYSSFERELEENGKLIYTNVGISMMPLIREGRDVMVIEKRDGKPKRYDAVLFRRDGVEGRGKYVVHRILKVLPGDKYFIAGDHDASGEIVPEGNILGTLTTVFKDGKPIDFGGFKYRRYVFFRCKFYHLRFGLLKAWRGTKYFFSAVRYKLFKK